MKAVGYSKDLSRILKHVRKHKRNGEWHWIWVGRTRTGSKGEYGGTRLNGKAMSSHRAVWILVKGKIPEGKDLLHQCPFTLCCNPDHFRLGTHRQNLEEAVAVRGGKHWLQDSKRADKFCKVSRKQIIAIIKRVDAGENRSKIAADFNISQPYVSILSKKHRRLLENET